MMFNSTLSVYEIHEKVMRRTRLLDRVRHAIRVRQCSLSTEKVYVAWIRRYILFHGKRHPAELGKLEIDVKTTMIYTHVAERGALGAVSPLDEL
jgi:hypothetical protein